MKWFEAVSTTASSTIHVLSHLHNRFRPKLLSYPVPNGTQKRKKWRPSLLFFISGKTWNPLRGISLSGLIILNEKAFSFQQQFFQSFFKDNGSYIHDYVHLEIYGESIVILSIVQSALTYFPSWWFQWVYFYLKSCTFSENSFILFHCTTSSLSPPVLKTKKGFKLTLL